MTHATMWRRNGKLREKSKPKGAIAQCRPLPRRLNMALVASVQKEEDAKNKKNQGPRHNLLSYYRML